MKLIMISMLALLSFNVLAKCKALPKLGICITSPMIEDAQKKEDRIVIYFRGYWLGTSYKGNVPQSKWIQSSQSAIDYYDLDKNAIKSGIDIAVVGSSHIRYNANEIKTLLKEANLSDNAKIIFASHSGGFVGLHLTLKNLIGTKYESQVEKILMLDNFYFSLNDSYTTKKYIDKGSKCSGFYTSHNKARLTGRYRKVVSQKSCPVEKRASHNSTVNNCLSEYILNGSCN